MGIFRRRQRTTDPAPELVDNGLTPGSAALVEHRVLIREQDQALVDSIIRRT